MNQTQYEVVAARRQAYDSMLWQTPALSLTAQAFLFTIALDPDGTRPGKFIASFLALFAAIASLQLMSKHRHHEKADSILLEEYETSQSWTPIHAKRGYSGSEWYLRLSSYTVWMWLLRAFALAALVILVSTILFPEFI